MRVEWIRNLKGQLRGVALLLGEGAVRPVELEASQPWRICDDCHRAAAIVFCQAHAVYLCDDCLTIHTVSRRCVYLSVSAARQLHQLETQDSLRLIR